MSGNSSKNKFFGVVKKVHRGELSKKDVTPDIWKASMRLNPHDSGITHETIKKAHWNTLLTGIKGNPQN